VRLDPIGIAILAAVLEHADPRSAGLDVAPHVGKHGGRHVGVAMMLCGWPSNSASLKPLISMKSVLAKTMQPASSARDTMSCPSRSSITLPVVIPLSRIACQPEYPARRWPVANESLACLLPNNSNITKIFQRYIACQI
jgi:hypothetical protein